MKLVEEFNIKVIIFIFIFILSMEIGILLFLLKSSGRIFIDTYNKTMINSKEKAIEITNKIQLYVRNLLIRQTTDLKLICKHASLLNGKNIYNSKSINKNSNLIINSNKGKQIIYAKTETLNEDKDIYKYVNKSTQLFDYFSFYEKEFQNVKDQNIILKNLLSDSHPELNKMGYYSLSNNEANQNLFIKFIISILKTIYIKRYIAKRENNDYIRFIILDKEEMYIYPPEAYNGTFLYNLYSTFQPQQSKNNSNDSSLQFPLHVYNFFNNKIKNRDDNYILLFFESILFENVFSTLCMKIPIMENSQNKAFICLEVNFNRFLKEIKFHNPENFDFGILYYDNLGLVPLSYGRKTIYEDIKDVFNDTVSESYIIDNNKSRVFDLFHFLYYNLTKISKLHPELKVNFTKIEEEYNIIKDKIIKEILEYNKTRETEKIIIAFTKTICRKGFANNNYECVQDEFEMIIFPIQFKVNKLNEDYLETQEDIGTNFNMYIFSILSTNPSSNHLKIAIILNLKLIRTIVLYFFITIILISFFLLIINLISEYFLNPTNEIINELKNNSINCNSKKCYLFSDDKISTPNKEMGELKNIFNIMNKAFIIKQAFEKENYLEKNNLEFCNLVLDIQNKNVKEICNALLGFYHLKHNSYSFAETELRSTLLYIKDSENKLISGKHKEYEDKIKDEIKRSSTISYINEYSKFEGIDEISSHIINLKIFKQRFIYLFAMTKFKLGSEINPNNLTPGINKNKIKKDKEKKMNYFKEAIKYFNICKNINAALGINQIKIIYSLIMISKCYIQLNEYSNAITNINEALSLFFEFSKSFKDYHSKNYNPKFMLFIENNVFQYILFTIQRICYTFNKPFASNWINLKIFETSPFLISNVHYYSAIFLQNYLDKNKLRVNKLDYKILIKEYDKAKKYFSKIIPRMNIKNMNRKKVLVNENYIGDTTTYSTSIKNKTESKTDKSMFSSTFKKEIGTGKISTLYTKNKNFNKIITLCLSEKVLKNVNGLELKDIIIKFFQKYFIMNENDKFNFIQFSNNGKKTIHLKMELLDNFILKILKTKNSFELTESFEQNKDLPFMELFNLFDSIVKSYPSQDDSITDNIIIMIINSDDIRFSSIKECLKIVDELNKNNVSVFLLTYDDEIGNQKVNNIHSFLNGLFEGYFFQIKSYQQLKQIFINLSTVKNQSNLFGYDYEGMDYLL